jgi:hypothetical protein
MGTLFNQRERNYRQVNDEVVENYVEWAVRIAKVHKVSVRDVLYARHMLEESRRNDLYVANGDAFDEQIGGIGELLLSLNCTIEKYVDKEK